MGRAANAVDWTEEGSGVGLRTLAAFAPVRTDSELRLRVENPEGTEGTEEALLDEVEDDDLLDDVDDEEPLDALDARDDEEPPTRRFHRSPGDSGDAADPLSALGIARLSALADWIESEEPSGSVVALVRAFLRDVNDVGFAVSALLAAASEAPVVPEVEAASRSLALAIGLWRANLVEHVDDLALSDHRSFSGWSSLPEYSAAYTLAIVQPALATTEAWATAKRGRSARLAPFVRAVGARVEALNATLRAAIARPSGSVSRIESSLSPAAW